MDNGSGETSPLHLLVEKKKENSAERTETTQYLFVRESSEIVTVSQVFLCVLEDKEVNQKLQKGRKNKKRGFTCLSAGNSAWPTVTAWERRLNKCTSLYTPYTEFLDGVFFGVGVILQFDQTMLL